jgi:integrase/recombinase XerD
VDQGRLRLVEGHLSRAEVPADPLLFQAECVEAFVASWTARGFAASTIGNDIGVLERMLAALGRPAWEVTAEDVGRVVGGLAAAGRATSTRRNYLQVFKGFHRFLEVRKAVEIEAVFGVRLVCPVDEYNSARCLASVHVRREALPALAVACRVGSIRASWLESLAWKAGPPAAAGGGARRGVVGPSG